MRKFISISMEGVKRIIVYFNESLIGSIRAPENFSDLRTLLESRIKLSLNSSSFKVNTSEVEFGRIFNQESYEEWLHKSGFAGLSLQIESRKIANKLKRLLKSKKPKKIYKYFYEPVQSNFPSNEQFYDDSSFFPSLSSPSLGISPESCLASIKASEVLQIYNISTCENLEIRNEKLQKSSRILILKSSILVTGGCKYSSQSFLIQGSDLSILELGPLNIPRFWHGMGTINGHPAVIGGCTSASAKTHIKSVEILREGIWMIYPSLNSARSSPSVAMHSAETYVLGGLEYFADQSFPLNSIEKWNGGSWTVINCLLPLALQSVGVYCLGEDKIIVFGGKDYANHNIDKVFEVQLDTGFVQVLKDLEKCTKFPYGCPIIKDKCIFMLDCDGQSFMIDTDQV